MQNFTLKPAGQRCDEIEYRIIGEDVQFVEIMLDPGETVVAEAGSMVYMNSDVEMKTRLSTSGEDSDLVGKLFSLGKRILTGESLFVTTFTAKGRDKTVVAFGAPYPGTVLPVDLKEIGGTIICQKDSFLCAAQGVSLDIEFTRKFGAGLFGGEGFILQKISGDGLAFIHVGGCLVCKELAASETLMIDTGCIAGFTPTVHYDIKFVGSIKSALFGGEGLFFATLTGPGKVFIQSLPFSRLAGRIYAATPQLHGKHVGEGSLLGGIGRALSGD